MSRIRTGHRPEDWAIRDDGATPSRHNRGIRGASFENPIQVAALPSTKYDGRTPRPGAHSPKIRPQKRDDLAGIPRATCGKTLRIIGEPCARNPGHAWDCKSVEALERDAARRRTERPVWQRESRMLGLR